MKGGYNHNYQHFTGKKRGKVQPSIRKRSPRSKKNHHDKYENIHDNIILVEEVK